MTVASILDISPEAYQQHPIHTKERDWAETNCYVDVWIEQLHALGLEPIAAMAFTLGIDFEGDQWTFFKFQLSDLYELYGIDVQELAIWKPLTEHIEQQIRLGRPILVELDSKYLPDTTGTAYQIAHVKSTVSINSIDISNRKLGYFHAQGYYLLEGQDFENVFRLSKSFDTSYLEPYVEIAKLNRKKLPTKQKTLEISLSLLKKQLCRMPKYNPFHKFKKQFVKDVKWLKTQNIEIFHQYSFATLRQFGACFETASVYLDWLSHQYKIDLQNSSKLYKEISESAKTFQFQLARATARGKDIQLTTIDDMADKWNKAKNLLAENFPDEKQ